MDNFSKIRRKEIIICLFLVLTTLAVYWQVTNHEFLNYDDNIYITENINVQKGFTAKNIKWAFTTFYAANWHPLTWLSHMLDCELYGLNPGGHHWTNVQFHIVNTLLLFFILFKMTGALWRSAFVAALFALHPLHVESVAWVAERKDVLSTFFGLITITTYCHYVRRPRPYKHILIIIFFSLALMAKPMLVTLPFLLLLLDFWPLKRFQYKNSVSQQDGSVEIDIKGSLHLLWEKTPLFILASVSSVLTFIAQHSGGAVSSLESSPITARLFNALVSYAGYVFKAIWPQKLSVFYPHPGNTTPAWQIVGAALLIAAATFFSIRASRKYPYIVVGLFWYMGTLVPVIGLVQVGAQAMADRYTYVPLIGLFIIAAWGVSDLLKKREYRKIFLGVLATLYLSTQMAATWKQVGYWENSTTLFKHSLNITVNNYIAHDKLGEALAKQNRTVEAIRHYSEALRIEPDFAQAHLSMGDAHASLGNNEDAILYYRKASLLNPIMTEAIYNLSWIFATHENKKYRNGKEAVKLAEQLCELQDYNHPLSLDALAAAYAEAGRFKEAVLTAKKGLALVMKMDSKELALGLENRLKLYQTGLPYRQKKHIKR